MSRLPVAPLNGRHGQATAIPGACCQDHFRVPLILEVGRAFSHADCTLCRSILSGDDDWMRQSVWLPRFRNTPRGIRKGNAPRLILHKKFDGEVGQSLANPLGRRMMLTYDKRARKWESGLPSPTANRNTSSRWNIQSLSISGDSPPAEPDPNNTTWFLLSYSASACCSL